MAAGDRQRDRDHRRPAHAHVERHGLSRTAEARLDALGRQVPPPSEEERKLLAADRAARVARLTIAGLVVAMVVVLGVLSTVQWLRPVPPPAIEGMASSLRVPGAAPAIPWPSSGEAALALQGLGGVAQSRGDQPAPIAGLVDVLTAYVILKDHPLATGGAPGPAIAVTPATLTALAAGNAQGRSEVAVTAGETLSELDALEGLLVASGGDMATLLADWDAGSTQAFVARMNQDAQFLGLRHTRVTDPSGADPATVSTPEDLVRLGEAAMRIPLFRQIVSLGQTTLPENGLTYNPDFDLGQDGIVGIVAGSNSATDGCFLFAATKTVGGRTATVYGAVLGQSGPNGPDTAAVDAGDALVRAALSAVNPIVVVPAGQPVARLAAAWGASTPVAASGPVSVLAWPGLEVPATVQESKVTVPLAAGSAVGTLRLLAGSGAGTTPLETTASLTGPSGTWRLVR